MKNQMTAMLRGKNHHMLADEPTVTVLDCEAKFIADHEIEVTTAAGEKSSIVVKEFLLTLVHCQ
ncbi:hypothetical protein IMAU10031_01334 [Lactobacillus helveticus]|nr:hypothetical protein [Lactobacillus helveticus]